MDDLDIIDQGHSKGNVSQYCLYLGYHLTNFNKTPTTTMESRRAIKQLTLQLQVTVIIYKSLYLDCHTTYFNKTFTKMMESRRVIKELTLKLQATVIIYKSLYLDCHTTDFNKIFTKMILLGLTIKAWHRLALKM